MDKDKLNDLRKQFESRWVPSNTLRTFLSILYYNSAYSCSAWTLDSANC